MRTRQKERSSFFWPLSTRRVRENASTDGRLENRWLYSGKEITEADFPPLENHLVTFLFSNVNAIFTVSIYIVFSTFVREVLLLRNKDTYFKTMKRAVRIAWSSERIQIYDPFTRALVDKLFNMFIWLRFLSPHQRNCNCGTIYK